MVVSNKFLVKKLKKNDPKAFEELFLLYSPKIINFCNRFFLSKEDVEEVVQLVFFAVWENRLQIDEKKSFLAYIFTIARNTIVNMLKKKTYRQGFINYALNKDNHYSFITEDEINFNELNEILKKCIDDLPEKRREIFLLSRIEGLSYQEISKKLSITESTVNSQITKSIVHIRKMLEKLY